MFEGLVPINCSECDAQIGWCIEETYNPDVELLCATCARLADGELPPTETTEKEFRLRAALRGIETLAYQPFYDGSVGSMDTTRNVRYLIWKRAKNALEEI